jgi:hypothetical protein
MELGGGGGALANALEKLNWKQKDEGGNWREFKSVLTIVN